MGPPDHVIREYLAAGLGDVERADATVALVGRPRTAWTAGIGHLAHIGFERDPTQLKRPPWRVAFGEGFALTIGFTLERHIPDLVVATGFRNDRGEDVLTTHSCDVGSARLPPGAIAGIGRVRVEQPWLRPGTYYVEAALLSGGQLLDYVGEAAMLLVEEQSADGAPPLPLKKGAVAPVWDWAIEGDVSDASGREAGPEAAGEYGSPSTGNSATCVRSRT